MYADPVPPVPESVLQKIQTLLAGGSDRVEFCLLSQLRYSQQHMLPVKQMLIPRCPSAGNEADTNAQASAAPKRKRQRTAATTGPQTIADASGHITYTVDVSGSDSDAEDVHTGKHECSAAGLWSSS